MQLRFLFGRSLPIEFNALFEIISDSIILFRLMALVIISAGINPMFYVLPFAWQPTFFVAIISGVIISTIYLSLLVVVSIFMLKSKYRTVHEPLLMASAIIFATPSFIMMQGMAYDFGQIGSPPDEFESAMFLFGQFFIYQLGINFIFGGQTKNSFTSAKTDTILSFLFPASRPAIEVGHYTIPKKHILWIKSQAHNICIKTTDDTIVVRASLAKVVDQLRDLDGMLIHRSTWVANSAILKNPDLPNLTLTTLDGEHHKIAREKVAKFKSWFMGVSKAELPQSTHSPADFPITSPFRPNEFMTPRQMFLVFPDPFVIKLVLMISAVLLAFDPLHWVSNLPLSYWLSYWPISSLTFLMTYPGVMIFGIYFARMLKLKSMWEIPIMATTHFYALFMMYQYGTWISDYYGFSYRYPIMGAAINTVLSELLLHLNLNHIMSLIQKKSTVTDPQLRENSAQNFQISITKNHLNTQDIFYVKSEGHYLTVIGVGKAKFFPGRISEMSDNVPTEFGVSPHRSYWVTPHGVKTAVMDAGKLVLTMQDGIKINVSRGRIDVIKEWLIAHGVLIK